MIRHTFSILSGSGPKRERRLWREGVLTWEDFLAADAPGGIAAAGKSLYDLSIAEAWERLGAGDAPYYASLVPGSEHWRLFERFRDTTAAQVEILRDAYSSCVAETSLPGPSWTRCPGPGAS